MGLDASVMCRCWADGKVRPPASCADHVELDEEGWLWLRLEWSEHRAEHEEFYAWQAACCPHPNMEAASEWVSNWSGYRAFQSALAQLGWDHFPELRSELPSANGGCMPAASCARALGELERFAELIASAQTTVLVDVDTGVELYKYVPQYEGVIVMDGEAMLEIGFDPRGIFVMTRSGPRREVFRSMNVEQVPVRLDEIGDPLKVRLVCRDGGGVFASVTPIHGEEIAWPDGRMQSREGRGRWACPRRLSVVTRPGTATDHEQVVGALRRLFEVAVATGNPVRWC